VVVDSPHCGINGHGHYSEALAAAQQACEREDVLAYGWPWSSLIEAGVRRRPARRRRRRARAPERTHTGASGTEWALGIEARCRALMSDDESLYHESIERLERSRAVVEAARSRLLYGEWLRRENRRVTGAPSARCSRDVQSHGRKFGVEYP